MPSVTIELDDTEYELEVKYFATGNAPSYDDPGAGAEIELEDTVKVWGIDFLPTGLGSGNGIPAVVDRISLDEFIDIYARHHDMWGDDARENPSNVLGAARVKLEEECIELMTEQLEDDYDDSSV